MDYKSLSDHSRVWIYQSDRKLSEEETTQIKIKGNQFITEWAAHGVKLQAAFEVFYNLFIVLFVDESEVKASGCSIDSSVRFIKELELEFQIDLFNRLNIAYKEGGEIEILPMSEFQRALKEGRLTMNTLVFNNLLETKGEFLKKWEVPVKDSWHKQLM